VLQMIDAFQFSFEGCLVLLALIAPFFVLDSLSSKTVKIKKDK